MYFISVLFLENIGVCLKAHAKYGPADSSHPVVTISERLRLSSGHPDAYGLTAWPLGPQIKDGVVLESL